MIKINNIYKTFSSDAFKKPVEVLKGVCFELKKGRTIGFLGANGAGKTTLMKIMMGFIHESSGSVEYDQSLGKDNLDALKNIGYMPERPYFYPHLKGREFIKYMGELSQVAGDVLEKNIDYWGRRFKIDHALDREIKGYSKGMLQRLGFMASLIHDPMVIIMDEPLSGLDPLGRKEFKDVIREVKAAGKTIFFSSHIVSDIEEVCDDVIFLKEGRIVFEGSLNEVYKKSQNNEVEIIFEASESFTKKEGHEQLSQQIYKVIIPIGLQQKTLEKLWSESCQIIKINPLGQTLEEVFYFSKEEGLL